MSAGQVQVNPRSAAQGVLNQDITCCFDGKAPRYTKGFKQNGLGKPSRILLEAVAAAGITGKDLLELGCGVGGLAFEFLRRGVAAAYGVDFSPQMIAEALSLASAYGFEEQASFVVGDVAGIELPRCDIVILDKAICCYRDMDALVDNSISACRLYYGFVIPRDKGL